MRLIRPAIIILFGLLPAGLFFWWSFQGCRLPAVMLPEVLYVPDGWRPLWNLFLFCTFGMLHSGLAEVGINRLVYMVIAGLTALAVIALWQPVSGELWQLGGATVARWFGAVQFVLWLALHGWIIHEMGVMEFFGFRNPLPRLVTSGPYAFCRHPMHANILLALLVTPVMTADRLTMLLAVSLYLVAAIPLEEARLQDEYLMAWDAYAQRTPMLIPGVL